MTPLPAASCRNWCSLIMPVWWSTYAGAHLWLAYNPMSRIFHNSNIQEWDFFCSSDKVKFIPVLRISRKPFQLHWWAQVGISRGPNINCQHGRMNFLHDKNEHSFAKYNYYLSKWHLMASVVPYWTWLMACISTGCKIWT